MHRLNYSQIKSYLFNQRFTKTKYFLESMERMTRTFGNPEKTFRTILVGGTNGKGSTSTFIHSILYEAGFKTGIFNSPFILEPTELIKVGKREITRDEFARYAREIFEMAGEDLSYFEYMTMISFLFFRDNNVDFGVLEVGLGGRLDATNITDPIISVITHISRDHTEILGKTLSKIAKEKAGIIRNNGMLIGGERRKELIDVLENGANKPDKSYFIKRDFNYEKRGENLFDYLGVFNNFKNLNKKLSGYHQFDNASISICAAELLNECGYKIDRKAIYSGIQNAYIRGRLDLLKSERWQSPVLIDIAHNVDGIRALSNYIKNNCKHKNLYIVLGIMGDKDFVQMATQLSTITNNITLVKPKYYRAWKSEEIKGVCKKIRGKIIEDIPRALLENLNVAKKSDLVCLTGSVYTVSEGLEFLESEEFVS